LAVSFPLVWREENRRPSAPKSQNEMAPFFGQALYEVLDSREPVQEITLIYEAVLAENKQRSF